MAWEVFPELYENPIGEAATIPPSSSSTSHTNIPYTTHHTLSIACTTNSYTSHTSTCPDLLHHTNTATPTTTSNTTFTPIIFPKHPRLGKTKKPAHTTSTASTTTTSTTTSITTSIPIIIPKISRFKWTKKSAQITIPKRLPLTLSPFILTDIRLKCHKIFSPSCTPQD